ncbi:MAG TPA: ATP-binding protein, partial [Methylomirabilota bacterium]|nr:ATP-binding protein [Methylomirabilota bacterium]
MKLARFNLRFAMGTDRKRDLIHIQWFVVIASVYLLVVQENRIATDPVTLLMLTLPLASMLVFLRLPDAVFSHRYFPQIMAIVDTVLISTAIVFNRQSPWDLCLVFFFGALVAAIGENLFQIVVGAVMVGIFSIVMVPVSGGAAFELDGNTLLRFPLLFGAALVYGYLADQLKRERRQAAEALESRRRELVMKDRLLSNVSHELRTPLTAVYQFVTILLDGIAGKLAPEQKEYLEIALRNVKQLQAMVGDLLETARANTGKLAVHPRAVSFGRLAAETVGTFLTHERARSVALTQDISHDLPLLHADPQRLRQILTNLIDNALKFTPEGGAVAVRARLCEEDNSFARISVCDTGCGIEPENLEKIFDRLFQEERRLASNRKGLGLGLHITKELVLRQGGRIWAESELGKGSTFYFTLPVYSLKRSLRFLLESAEPASSLSIIATQVSPPPSTPPDVVKAIYDMAWVALHQMELPEQTVMLSNIMPTGGRGRFYFAHTGDFQWSQSLARRIER